MSKIKMSNIVGIFAHPDDEAFGPGGTLAQLSKTNDVYIICVTSGDIAGEPDIRQKELLSSAHILGIKKVFFLKYEDGSLCNRIYHELAADVRKILDDIQPEQILTFDMRGVSGHIDHITVSMVTSYLFNKLSYIKEIWYFCIDRAHRALIEDYFIYFPDGYSHEEIDATIDISDVWEIKMKAMKCHQSQMRDIERVTVQLKKLPKEEYFLIRKK